MNFLGIGTGELLLILLIVLLVMGPERLPQLIRQWAKVVKTLSQFTRTWQQFNAELNRQLTLEDLAGNPSRPIPKPAPAPTPSPPATESESTDNTIAPPMLAELAATSEPVQQDAGALSVTGQEDGQGEQTFGPAAATEEPRHEQ
ncbi:MAG TPA: twin-arginine translocase TatA/TatE family subunit [Anaerolineae bacterium]|nr:twin-arginine translocase TatA/TatE family subunit [Anaerolineae bacterium]